MDKRHGVSEREAIGWIGYVLAYFTSVLTKTAAALIAAASFSFAASAVSADFSVFKQRLAEAVSTDADIAEFYRVQNFQPIWTGNDPAHLERRTSLIEALKLAEHHGLPGARYDWRGLMAMMRRAQTTSDLATIEFELSEVFLRYARDVQTGILVPSRIDADIVRQVPYRDRTSLLINFVKQDPAAFLSTLPPDSAEYLRLMKHKLRLEAKLNSSGWGPEVRAKSVKPGQSGPNVIDLRNRLIAMGYMPRTTSANYGSDLEAAVQKFQEAHGLEVDGVAGAGTLDEINVSLAERLQSVIVAMERKRWFNRDRGTRHVLVNLADFHAKIMDNDRVTFQTRSVIGKNVSDQRSPGFSDVMEHMIINPSWYVPRSIITKEYLPKLQRNPNAVSYLEITDRRGRVVNRGSVNFSQFSARTFHYAMRQPPGAKNALGLVKFMFPNKYNIYLHDTPQKALFDRESRAYSHGCIRLADPFDFAYALLAVQSSDPEGEFQSILKSKRETKVDLVNPVPVHLIYRTAYTTDKGALEFRRDVYGRDAKIWDALRAAGVAMGSVQG